MKQNKICDFNLIIPAFLLCFVSVQITSLCFYNNPVRYTSVSAPKLLATEESLPQPLCQGVSFEQQMAGFPV